MVEAEGTIMDKELSSCLARNSIHTPHHKDYVVGSLEADESDISNLSLVCRCHGILVIHHLGVILITI